MSRDFSSPVFFIKQLLLVPIGMPRNNFEFFRIFVVLFIFVTDSPVMNTPGSRLESLKLDNFCQYKSHKTTPQCQNDFLLMNTPASLDSPVVNILGSLDYLVMNTPCSLYSPVMNTQGSRLLSALWTSIRTALQKNFLVNNRPGSQDSQCINHYLLPSVFCTSSVLLWTNLSRLNSLVMNTPGSHDHPVVNTPRSHLRIWITPQIFKKVWNPFKGCLTGLGKVVWWKKAEWKRLVTLSL